VQHTHVAQALRTQAWTNFLFIQEYGGPFGQDGGRRPANDRPMPGDMSDDTVGGPAGKQLKEDETGSVATTPRRSCWPHPRT